MRFVLRSPGERSMTPVVLDISHHNTVLDFAKVKAATVFTQIDSIRGPNVIQGLHRD
jgi:hypothetical protein